jgi:rfaE bifunctional protein nucleotidyltransferase chain/domain
MKKIFNFTTEKLEITKLLHKLEKVDKVKSIVFTNGCFDLTHSIHVNLLNESKKLGDILIVGMNSDESVKQLKGDDRPIICENDRAFVLSNLISVDYIIIFDEVSVLDLIKFINPDIITKGDDYNVNDLNDVGGKYMKENNKRIELIVTRNGLRTSDIINKIIKTYK